MNLTTRPLVNSDLRKVNTLLQQLSRYSPRIDELQSAYNSLTLSEASGIVCEHIGDIIGVGFIYFLQKIRGGGNWANRGCCSR